MRSYLTAPGWKRKLRLMIIRRLVAVMAAASVLSVSDIASAQDVGASATPNRTWLAGDHHIHSRFSLGYASAFGGRSRVLGWLLGADGIYPTATNAQMALQHGLSWMVTTDHGGPRHARLNHDVAYPELIASRNKVSQVLQFYGMEFDTPGGDHSSIILPRTDAEQSVLLDLESRFSTREAWPPDRSRDTEPRMLDALRHMQTVAAPPVVIAHHPSRTARGVGVYGAYDPAEFRDWNDLAPEIAVGMEGAPGHQAAGLTRDGSGDPDGRRGSYRHSPTLGGFDQMTARLGGFWDSMLGEGRRWWITSTSDSHKHYTEGGSDFWPGEYSKTYVRATRDHADILDGLRNGRVFVTTGDLVSELDVTVTSGERSAAIGGRLLATPGQAIAITIRLRDPAAADFSGSQSDVSRVDLIIGDITGPRADRDGDSNPSTRVAQRFTEAEWRRDGEVVTMTYSLPDPGRPIYVRVRGTSTTELEPRPDPAGENPWTDLWFYSNPVFIEQLSRL